MSIYELIGWTGALSFIAAYLLLVAGFISSEKPLYHVLNALGGIFLTINAIHLLDMPTVVVNLVWTIIAGFAIYKVMARMRKHRSEASDS